MSLNAIIKGAVLVVLLIVLIALLFGCTDNQMAKQYGGTINVTLPANRKLVTATWKDTDLWYLTRQMRAGETAETYEFKEQSSFGLIQGTVVFSETIAK